MNSADSLLEPALLCQAKHLNAEERIALADVYSRWSDQLTQSAWVADPDLTPLVTPPTVPRGFFLVNLSRWQREMLCDLGQQCGVDLRSAVRWAITSVVQRLNEKVRVAEMLGVHPKECWRLSEGREQN
ncbi:MAG TPA: hypothetical protein VK530_19280 [Candidatus Acidoferrum sp.]|nr:hypothetical protein [Candidatus Acidoferrum sp.]